MGAATVRLSAGLGQAEQWPRGAASQRARGRCSGSASRRKPCLAVVVAVSCPSAFFSLKAQRNDESEGSFPAAGSSSSAAPHGPNATSALLAKVHELMNDKEGGMHVLEAERLLAAALRDRSRGRGGGAASAEELQRTSIYAQVAARAEQYESGRAVLEPADFHVCWEAPGARMWVHAPRGAAWFEYRLIAHMNASLRHCLCPLHEYDLIPQFQDRIESHVEIGAHSKHHGIFSMLSKICALYFETVYELLRVSNTDFGFLIELASSHFRPDQQIPEKEWWVTKRVEVDTKSLWLPRGGNASGTILVTQSRVQVGLPLPEAALRFILHSLSPSMLENFRRGAALAMQPGSPWSERLEQDVDGFYGELAAVEAAAARRKAVSENELPSPEIFDRQTRLK